MAQAEYIAVVHREEDRYLAYCPEVGTIARGDTIQNALDLLRTYTEQRLFEYSRPDHGRPLLTTIKVTKQRKRDASPDASLEAPLHRDPRDHERLRDEEKNASSSDHDVSVQGAPTSVDENSVEDLNPGHPTSPDEDQPPADQTENEFKFWGQELHIPFKVPDPLPLVPQSAAQSESLDSAPTKNKSTKPGASERVATSSDEQEQPHEVAEAFSKGPLSEELQEDPENDSMDELNEHPDLADDSNKEKASQIIDEKQKNAPSEQQMPEAAISSTDDIEEWVNQEAEVTALSSDLFPELDVESTESQSNATATTSDQETKGQPGKTPKQKRKHRTIKESEIQMELF
ncbi:MAG: type II toxin-antitoxin system HicB family antitoxin [Bacteroidota bacterium]